MLNYLVYLWRMYTQNYDYLFLFLNLDAVLTIKDQNNSPALDIERDRITAMKFETAWIYFLSEVFAGVFVVDRGLACTVCVSVWVSWERWNKRRKRKKVKKENLLSPPLFLSFFFATKAIWTRMGLGLLGPTLVTWWLLQLSHSLPRLKKYHICCSWKYCDTLKT